MKNEVMYPLKHATKQMRLDNTNREDRQADRQTEVDDL
jgi:hypothetical protein